MSDNLFAAVVIVAIVACIGLREWLRHSRRTMIHRERLAAIEKGIELPALEQEALRAAKGVQRFLLLGGLIWVSVGAGAYITLTALLNSPTNADLGIPHGIQWIGVAPAAIGLSHIVVWFLQKREQRSHDGRGTK